MKTTSSRRRTLSRTCAALVLGVLMAPAAANAWDMPAPNDGTWSFAAFENSWARGGALWCQHLTSSGCGIDSLVGFDWNGPGDANNALSSYEVCNNTTRDLTFTSNWYRDADYVSLFQHDSFTVEHRTCVVRDLLINDVTTSFTINPTNF